MSLFIFASRGQATIIQGDSSDGEIRFDNASVLTAGTVHAFGHRGGSGAELKTSIYFFELPDLSPGEVHNASLHFSFLNRSGDFVANPAHADVWGLGFVSSTTINTSWHLLGDADVRTGNDLSTGIGTNTVRRLSNNFLTNESNNPSPGSYRMALADDEVAAFIALLYDQGAVAGDYAIIRINVDTPTSIGERGFNIASADAVDITTRPTLSINENSTLLYDTFDDGDRTEGSDPLDTSWYKVSGSMNLSVADDTAGIGHGNALYVENLTAARRFLCGFPSVTLANPGDFIQLSCTFRPVFTLGADEAFRMGIFSAAGSSVVSDVTAPPFTYEGNMIRMSTDGVGDLSLVGVPQGTFLGGSVDLLSRLDNALSVTAPDSHFLRYTITRASATQMTTRVELSNTGGVVVLNGMDPGTDMDLADHSFYDTFDSLGIGSATSSEAVDLLLDNVLVQTSVNNIRDHSEVLAHVIELELPTEADAEYTLESSFNLTVNDWTVKPYTLFGNGTSLSFFVTTPVEPAKYYRAKTRSTSPEGLFTNDLSVFNSTVDLGNGTDYGVEVAQATPGACTFSTGNALRLYDFYSSDKPELQGELAKPILEPFQLSFQSCNQSVSTNASPAIRWRMGNTGQSQSSAGRAAFSISWHADLSFSATYLSSSNTTEALISAPLSAGIHDVVLVGNAFTNSNYSYTYASTTRILNPLSYDVFIDGVLFNNGAQFNGGLGFSTNNLAANYDPTLGLQRIGLQGSSSSDTDPDVWFDNILLTIGEPHSAFPIEANPPQIIPAFSIASTTGGVYILQSTTNPPAPVPVWQHTGMELLGDGSTQLLFDAEGFSTNKSYRVVEKP